MSGPREVLPVGVRPGAFGSAALCAGALMATAVAVHLGGLAVGAGVLAGCVALALAAWHEADVAGPQLNLRGPRSGWRRLSRHARAIDRMEYRRSLWLPRFSLHAGPGGTVLRASGATPRAPAFRQAALWLIVHGRRQARIDPALLDALGTMNDHARTGQPHDTSHA